jgi:hypothetical protein
VADERLQGVDAPGETLAGIGDTACIGLRPTLLNDSSQRRLDPRQVAQHVDQRGERCRCPRGVGDLFKAAGIASHELREHRPRARTEHESPSIVVIERMERPIPERRSPDA